MLKCLCCGKESTHQFIRKDGLTQNFHADNSPPCEAKSKKPSYKGGIFVFGNKIKQRGYSDDQKCPNCSSKNLIPHRNDERFEHEGRKLSVTTTQHECLDCKHKWYFRDPEEAKKKVIGDAFSRPVAHKRRMNGFTRRVMKRIFKTEDAQCTNPDCGSKENLTFDHIIPLSKGGSGGPENIQILCSNCNQKKADKIL